VTASGLKKEPYLANKGTQRDFTRYPLVASLAFILVFAAVFSYLDISNLSTLVASKGYIVSFTSTPPEHVWRKLFFGVSLVALTTILLWNIVVHIEIIRRNLPKVQAQQRDILKKTALVVCPVLVIVIAIVGFIGGLSDFFLDHTSIFVRAYIGFNNILTAIVIGLTVVCSCTLARPSTEDTIQVARERAKHFLLSICSASALLAVGVIEIYLLYSWTSRLVDVPQLKSQADALQSLVNTMTLGAGVCFSLLLIVIYLPPAIVQNELLSKLLGDAKVEATKQGLDDFNADTWRAMHGLPKSVFESMAGLVAIVMPFVTGIIPNLLS